MGLKVKLKLPCSVRDEVVSNLLSIEWRPEAVHLVIDDFLKGGVPQEASVRIGHTIEIPQRLLLQTTCERCPKREFEHLFGFPHGEFEEGKCISVERNSLVIT